MKFKLLLIGTVLTFACVTIVPATGVVPTLVQVATPTATDTGCPSGCRVPPAGCLIKGNVNATGQKIYHLAGTEFYTATNIVPSQGERWFCTEDEAVANGWRKAIAIAP